MRNLKKILALVLALVMSLSLMATAGAADAAAGGEQITPAYKTAIDVLKGVEVFRGYEDGSIKPQNTITRAEVATILYRIATGDVKDAQSSIYTDMNASFSDLNQANWARGYVNYCQNAELIVGVGGGKFNPNDKITGYATLAMILRALGYDKNGEFRGSGWEIRTAAKAHELGITKNITEAQLGGAATREMVAEILFRAILNETVTYSVVTSGGYTKTGETLAKKNLGLEEVEGVVMGNEYANLEDTDVLPEGKTKLDGNLIDYTTNFDDIGERKLAYLQNGKKVLSIADSSKNTREFTLDEGKLSDLLKKAGLSAGDAEHFINFDEFIQYTTPYRIRYVLEVRDGYLVGTDLVAADVAEAIKDANGDAVVTVNATAISVVLKPKSGVSSVDLDWMEYIFADGDLENNDGDYKVGEIYVNTQSTKDISDDPDYYFEKFVETFMEYTDNVDLISNNENGNWLKVIDNDADGVAEYVLKVIYTGAQVERIKNDTITLDVKNHALTNGHDRIGAGSIETMVNTLTKQDVVNMSDEALEEGDVVYYAIIDGVARAYKAEMVSATIDKINRNTKSTTTTDEGEYTESGVCNHILDPEYADQVTDLVGKVQFDLFLDRGGYLLAFVKSNRSGDFKLITDGWFNSTKNGHEYAVKVYNEDEDKQEIVDLTAGGSMFIGRDVEYFDGKGNLRQTDNNDWIALKYLGGTDEDNGALNNLPRHTHATADNTEVYFNGAELNGNVWACKYENGKNVHYSANYIKTTVASVSEDGEILPVEDYAVAGRYQRAMIDIPSDKIPTSAYTAGTVYVTSNGSDTAYDEADGNVELRALSTTKYYVVWPDGEGGVGGVKAFTGYSSVGAITSLVSERGSKGLELVEDVYAVGTLTRKDNEHSDADYYTADIVVIELNDVPSNSRSIVLLVDDEGQVDRTGLRHVQIIDAKGSSKWIDVNSYSSVQLLANNYDKKLAPGLYWCSENGDELYKLEALSHEEIRDAGCFLTGQVQYYRGTTNSDYVVVNPAAWVDSAPVVDTANTSTAQPIIVEGSKFYTLGYGYSYGSIDDYREYPANLSDEDEMSYRDVLVGRVEGVDGGSKDDPAKNREYFDTTDRQSYFYNDVLVRYNSDNEIVYAVSFQNAYNDAGNADFAQRVWENVVPAPAHVDYITFSTEGAPDGFVVPATKVVDSGKDYSFTIAGEWLANYEVTVSANPVGNYDELIEAKADAAGNVTWTLRNVTGSVRVTISFVEIVDTELVNAKIAAKAALDAAAEAAKEGKSDETKAAIDAALEAAKAAVDAAGTVEDVAAAKDAGLKAIEEAAKEEEVPDTSLEDAKAAAKKALEDAAAAAKEGKDDETKAAIDAALEDALKAVEEAETVEAVEAAEDAGLKAIEEAAKEEPVEPGEKINVTFQYAKGSEKKFNSVELTLPTAQEVKPGETVTVVGIPAAKDVKDEMSNLQTYLILLSKEDLDAEDTTEADVYTMDQYTTPAKITAGDAGMVVYCYYGITTLSGDGEPDDPVIPPPDDDGIIILSLDEGIQTMAITKPEPVETYTTWILAPKAMEELVLVGADTLYTDVVGPNKYNAETDKEPANADYVLGAAEKYAETHNLWWVTYKMAEGQTWAKPSVTKGDDLAALIEEAKAEIESWKSEEIKLLGEDDLAKVETAKKIAFARIDSKKATAETIADAVKAYKAEIAKIVSGDDTSAGPDTEDFVSLEDKTVDEHGNITETFVNAEGVKVKKTVSEDEGYTEVNLGVTMGEDMAPTGTVEDSDLLSKTTDPELKAAKDAMAEQQEGAEAAVVTSFKVYGPEGIAPEIDNVPVNMYVVATADEMDSIVEVGKVSSSGPAGPTTVALTGEEPTTMWTITVLVKVTVAGGKNTVAAVTANENGNLVFDISFPNVDSSRADAKKMVDAYLVTNQVTKEQVQKEYDALMAAIDAQTDTSKLTEDGLKATAEWKTFAAAVTKVLGDAEAAAALKTAKENAVKAVDALLVKEHVAKADVQDEYDALVAAINACTTTADLEKICKKVGGTLTLQESHEAVLALKLAIQNLKASNPFKAIFAAPLADTKGIVEEGGALVNAKTYAAVYSAETGTVTVTAEELRLHGRGETNQDPAPEELGYWAGFFVQAPATMPNANGFETPVAKVKANWGSSIAEDATAGALSATPSGEQGTAFYCNQGGTQAYLDARQQATIQWCDESGNDLGDPITVDIVWDCTWSKAAPFTVTKANLHDNATTGAVADADICKDYKVTATQIGWNEVDVTISAKDLVAHKGDKDLGAGEDAVAWIGFGVVAPTAAASAKKQVVENGLIGDWTSATHNAQLNNPEGSDNNMGGTWGKTGFVQYIGLRTGDETMDITLQWLDSSGNILSQVVYHITFDVTIKVVEDEKPADPEVPETPAANVEDVDMIENEDVTLPESEDVVDDTINTPEI